MTVRRHGALLLLVVALVGCGYTLGFRRPEGVYKLAVPVFRNETFPLRREIEIDLTRAVRQQFDVHTDLELVQQADADAVLDGIVLVFDEAVVTEGALDTVLESSIAVTVRIRLTRRSNGSEILARDITDHVAFSRRGGESIEDARAEAVREIAARIVAEVEAW